MDVERRQGTIGHLPTGEGRWTIVTMAFAALLLTLACVGHQAGARQEHPAATALAIAGLS